MKQRVLAVLLTAILIFTLSACGAGDANTAAHQPEQNTTSQSWNTEEHEDGNTNADKPETSQNEGAENSRAEQPESAAPVVYFTSDISPEGLRAIYEVFGWEPTGNLAIKVSTGEPPASNYLRQDLIGFIPLSELMTQEMA